MPGKHLPRDGYRATTTRTFTSPACGERSDRGAVRVRGSFNRHGAWRVPLTRRAGAPTSPRKRGEVKHPSRTTKSLNLGERLLDPVRGHRGFAQAHAGQFGDGG